MITVPFRLRYATREINATSTQLHTDTQTHRQNDYRTLLPTLSGEGN